MASGDVDCKLTNPLASYGIFGDGIDDYVDTGLPSTILANDFSINIWCQVTSDSENWKYLLASERVTAPYSSGVSIFITIGKSLFFYYPVTLEVIASVDDGVWHMLTMVRDKAAGTYEGFIDGVSVGTSAAVADPATTATTIKLFTSADATTGFGKMGARECSIYQRKLTQAEITALYNYLTVPTDAYAYWKFNGNLLDSSGNGRNCTIGSGTYYGAVDNALNTVVAAQRAATGSSYKTPYFIEVQQKVMSTFIDT